MPHFVTLRLLATVEIPDAGSPDEASAISQAALADVTVDVWLNGREYLARLRLDELPVVAVIGEGEDPAPDN